MSITNSKNKKLRHYDLNIRTTIEDSRAFTAYILDNKLYKSKKLLRILLQICVTVILFAITLVISLFLSDIGWNDIERIIAVVCLSILIVNVVIRMGSSFPKISKSDVEEAVMSTIAPWNGKTEREVLFSLGEKGFSTNAGMIGDTKIYEYGVFNRIIECELGIIMILNDIYIYCIPARFFNDETACFITEKLRKKCRFKYKTKGLMKITRN